MNIISNQAIKSFVKLIFLLIVCSKFAFSGFYQQDQYPYLQAWNGITQYSYQEQLPPQLAASCKDATSNSLAQINYVNYPSVYLNGSYDSTSFQNVCGTSSICILNQGSTLVMNGNLNVAALKVLGTVYWNETSQLQSVQWLCAGYVVIERNGILKLSLNSMSRKAYVYIKNNGAVHSKLRTRVFGGYNTDSTIVGPTIDVQGRTLTRTWSLLFKKVSVGSSKIQLIHNPVDMGWQIGDRITIAPTTQGSSGYAESYLIKAMNTVDNTIMLDTNITKQSFNANVLHNGTSSSVGLLSAEVINLSRNVIITGDDFKHVKCDPTLSLTNGVNSDGCACNPSINRTICTMGLHTIMAGKGTYNIQYSRLEKCGQRGIFSKYCLHFHMMGVSPQSVLRGNAIENGQQRGIIIHGTHLTTVEHNVLSDIRGTGIFIQDGNEMYNKIMYNIVICPLPKDGPLGGCTIPGTDNGQSDTTLNQAGLWANSRTNDMVGNRFANSFNGMFYDFGSVAAIPVDALSSIMGRVEGNTFHGHGRFGTYVLQYFPQAGCIGDISNKGYIPITCQAFTASGLDNGYAVVLSSNVDYDNVFVGGYSVGDVQYHAHIAQNNNNNIYWKESKNFADGCSAHISNSYYADGNIALPDSAAFIIENTIFTGSTSFETNHHCNEGPTGFLCMPTYVFVNVSVRAMSSTAWVVFHQHGNNYGSILTLPPPEASNPTGAGGFFPPTYQSLVSFYYSYLLDFGNATCQKAISLNNAWPGVAGTMMYKRYEGGIFCRKPVRSLKIYTYGLSYATAYNMSLQVWKGSTLVTSSTIQYHQIGSDLTKGKFQPRQGYAFPVIADPSYEYRLSMINNGVVKYPNGNLPSDWIVEFSDTVFGNRWTPDKITLTVQGQGCSKKLVTSQHDRRWVWTENSFYPSPQAWGRGACNSTNPDMPPVTCSAAPKPVPHLSCDGQCSTSCQNGYCDCGSKQCVCDAGYYGSTCSQNICDSARCGSHGKCIAKYLGGELLPSQGTCACDEGWGGPTCDQNVCSGVTCSGRGYCQAKGDTDYQCICDNAYFGRNCEKVKQDTCPMCPSTFVSVCGMGKLLDNSMYVCNAGTGPSVGCAYPKAYTQVGTSACCYSNCEKCDLINCPPATNDCYLSGSCNPLDGTCGAQVKRSDGSPCNSIPYGVCLQGICQPSALTPQIQTYAPSSSPPSKSVPSYTPTYTPTPVTRYQTKYIPSITSTCIPSVISSQIPTATPTSTPSVTLSMTPTYIPSLTPTYVPSITPTYIPSIIPSKIPTATPTRTPFVTLSMTPTYISSLTPTYAPSSTPTYIPSVIPSKIPTATPTSTPSVTLSMTPTYISSLTPTYAPSSTPTYIPSIIPSKILTATPTSTPYVTLSMTPTYISSLTPAYAPSSTPTYIPSIIPSKIPTVLTSTPSVTLSMTPTHISSLTPTYAPSITPTYIPSIIPSKIPTATPTSTPYVTLSMTPTYISSLTPTYAPSSTPTYIPSIIPSKIPTATPTSTPYVTLSMTPTYIPSSTPTYVPSSTSTYISLFIPSKVPTTVLTSTPSVTLSMTPTYIPSLTPTYVPFVPPRSRPSEITIPPSFKLSVLPTYEQLLSSIPTFSPTTVTTLTTVQTKSTNILNVYSTPIISGIVAGVFATVLCAFFLFYCIYRVWLGNSGGRKVMPVDKTYYSGLNDSFVVIKNPYTPEGI